MPIKDNMAERCSSTGETEKQSEKDNDAAIQIEEKGASCSAEIKNTEKIEMLSKSQGKNSAMKVTNGGESKNGGTCRIDDLQQQVYGKFKAIHQTLKLKRNQYSFIHSEQPKQKQTALPISIESSTSTISKQHTTLIDLRTKAATKSNSNSTAANCSNFTQRKTKNTGMGKQLPKVNNSKTICEKWHHDLKAQVAGLHKLLDQLILENPQLRSRISSIIENIPELKHFEGVFDNRLEGGFDPEIDGCASTSKGRGNTNMVTTLPGQQKPEMNLNDDECEVDHTLSRKRGKRGGRKRKNSNMQKNQLSELSDLAKYINGIVEDYEKKNEILNTSDISLLPKFDGGFDNLEDYAGCLVKQGLGRIVEDELRVNRKNNRQSFITMSSDRETLERDGMIMMPVARRYAFEGDIVRAFVLNSPTNIDSSTDKLRDVPKDLSELNAEEDVLYEGSDSLDSDLDTTELLDTISPTLTVNCPKAFVIQIVKHTDDRKVVGTISFKHTIQLSDDDDALYYKFRPLDTRMPLMYVPESVGALHAREAKLRNEITDLFFLAQICQTDTNGHCIAELLELVGKVGHLEHELKAILLHNGLKDIKPYEQRFCDLYADPGLPQLSKTELQQRMDLRKKCIFTIDPATARDLDDALSVEKISENLYEIGVHIADVSYFLEESCELDDIVKQRATSIYLVNEVIHMLPQTLCFKCSLLPGEDKLAFSVFWNMNLNGDVIGEPRFTRSIMNSCTKFAYGHAQKFIENPNFEPNVDEFPDIYNGFTLSHIADCIRILNEMARNMRCRRFDDGALSINNPKLRFELNPFTGEPVTYDIDKLQEANHMIEEFMLLANRAVAKHIYTHFPNISILRNHAPPLMTSMKTLQEKLSTFGLNLDCNSSKAVYASLLRICNEAENPKAMNACLSTLLTKPMARAKYICSEDKTESEMWHYALCIPIYTHFTSPIRRYPDIMVHRLLAATLNYSLPPQRTPEELRELANICNIQKFNAKNASDESSMLYFKRYVKTKQGINIRAVVLEIHQHLTNVVSIETGHVFPILYKAQKVIVDKSNAPTFIRISEKGSKQSPLQLKLFSQVDIKIVVRDEKLIAFFVSPDLKQRQINCIEMHKVNSCQKNPIPGRKIQLSARQEQRLQILKKQQQKEKENNFERQMQTTQTKQERITKSTQQSRNGNKQRYRQEKRSISEQEEMPLDLTKKIPEQQQQQQHQQQKR